MSREQDRENYINSLGQVLEDNFSIQELEGMLKLLTPEDFYSILEWLTTEGE